MDPPFARRVWAPRAGGAGPSLPAAQHGEGAGCPTSGRTGSRRCSAQGSCLLPAPAKERRLRTGASLTNVTSIIVEQSRAIPIELPRAFEQTLPMPLTAIFSRRFALLPPVKEVRGQQGVWGQPGQTRTVVTTDGGTMRELLTEVDAPSSFSYLLSDITGPMRPLVNSIDGHWEFTTRGTGTLIIWRWTLHPTAVGAYVMPLIILMWRSYARQALELLSDRLLADESV